MPARFPEIMPEKILPSDDAASKKPCLKQFRLLRHQGHPIFTQMDLIDLIPSRNNKMRIPSNFCWWTMTLSFWPIRVDLNRLLICLKRFICYHQMQLITIDCELLVFFQIIHPLYVKTNLYKLERYFFEIALVFCFNSWTLLCSAFFFDCSCLIFQIVHICKHTFIEP